MGPPRRYGRQFKKLILAAFSKLKGSRFSHLVLGLLLFSFPSWGQGVGLLGSTGTVLKRSQNLGNAQDIYTYALFGDLSFQTDAPAYGNPEVGLTLHYQNYSSVGIGQSASLFAFVQKRFSLAKLPGGLKLHWGIGPIGVERVFDIDENYSSQTVSSHLNLGADARLALYYSIWSKWEMEMGVSFFHASNMSMRKPNYGLNVPAFYCGLKYAISERPRIQVSAPEVRSEAAWLIYYNAASRQITYGSSLFFVHNFNVEYRRKLNSLFNLTLGASIFQEGVSNELNYYDGHYQLEEYQPFGLQHAAAGPYLGAEFFVGSLSAFAQVGYYLFHSHRAAMRRTDISPALENYINYYNRYFVFNRLGIRYQLGPNWILSLAGKTQVAKVQYLELGFGYSW